MASLDEGLVLYLPFSEGSGSKAFDGSPAQNHGTLNGPVWLKPNEGEDQEGDNPLVIYDDDETFWTFEQLGTGSYDYAASEETTIVKRGSSSYKIVSSAGTRSWCRARHWWGSSQDWSQKDFISLWFYGSNSGKTFRIDISSDATDNTWNNSKYHNIVDNFTGWRRFILLRERFSVFSGTLDWSSVYGVALRSEEGGNWNGTVYLDRTIVDVGNWRFGEALDFDGTDDDITVSHDASIALITDFSIAFWCYPYRISGDNYILDKYTAGTSGYIVEIIDGKIRLYLYAGSLQEVMTDNIVISLNSWNHVTVTRSGSSVAIYINGVLVKTGTISGDILTSSDNLLIGALNGSGRYNGILDELRIYRRVLSSNEVRTLYLEKAFDLNRGLVLHMSFDEGVLSPTTVRDKSRVKNHGTLQGAVLVKPYENDQTDEGENPTVIYDDDETFWTGSGDGAGGIGAPTLSEETSTKQKGQSSLKTVVDAGAFELANIYHDYGAGQDWSQFDYLVLWLYGINTGSTIYLHLSNQVKAAIADHYRWDIVDNFSGWKRIILVLNRPSTTGGNFTLTSVRCILIRFATIGTWYLDRTIVDVGNWRLGEAADFDGINDYINIPHSNSLNLEGDFSIVAWVKRVSRFTYNCYIFAKSEATGAPILLFNTANKLRLQVVGGNNISSNRAINDSNWHQIAFIKSGTTWKLYIDGILDKTATYSDLIIPNANAATISHGGNPFAGYIDELRIYKRVLALEEIRTLYEMRVK